MMFDEMEQHLIQDIIFHPVGDLASQGIDAS